MEDDFVGAIKIKDGLFIGDEYAAQDFEFVVTNKVTHIINCAGKQIPNYWESVGVMYLTYDWDDSETQIVFDAKGEIVNQILAFIEEAASLGEGVLVHSLKGQSRSCCVLTSYFMKRYHWSLYKTLEFLTSRRSDLEIRTSFYHQLLDLESRIFQGDINVTVNWQELGEVGDHEEVILRNTFLNARSAPFDEALVNPQPGVDTRPRKLNWGDEKPSHQGGLALYLGKESLAAMMAKPSLSSVKSILKGSNKVFKLKAKFAVEEDEPSPVATPARETKNTGIRINKSMRNFSESRSSEPVVDDSSIKVPIDNIKETIEKNQETVVKALKGPNMSRSSSASIIEKEAEARSSAKGSFFTSTTEKPSSANAKVSNINGNIIHLTVNNYLVPIDNINNTGAAATQVNTSNPRIEEKPKQSAAVSKGPDSRPPSYKYNLPLEINNKDDSEKNRVLYQDNSPLKSGNNDQPFEKTSLSTSHLKSAIEKKLSKEYKSQLSSASTMTRGGLQPVTVKSYGSEKISSESKATFKEYSRPNDIKVNYQVLLKNRETPPPRKREEAKKVLDSPIRKGTSKTTASFSTKAADSSNLPYSSYLNNLFTSSLSQLNSITPSGYGTNSSGIEKKTPISTKGTPVSYNLTMSQKNSTLSRPQRSSVNPSFTSSLLASSFSKSKLMVPNEPSSATNLSSKYNNYITQAKANPVRITYENFEKVDRPHSATPDRSVTPQANMKRLGASISSGFHSKPSEQRSSAPLKGSNKSVVKKELGLSQDMLMSKYRQRSSSPLQLSYNPVLSSSSISLKTRPKY